MSELLELIFGLLGDFIFEMFAPIGCIFMLLGLALLITLYILLFGGGWAEVVHAFNNS